LVENALREDLKPVEQARAYKRLMDAHGWASRQLAAELNIKPGSRREAWPYWTYRSGAGGG